MIGEIPHARYVVKAGGLGRGARAKRISQRGIRWEGEYLQTCVACGGA